MSSQVFFDNHLVTINHQPVNVSTLKREISQLFNLPHRDLFATINGRRVEDNFNLNNSENVVGIHTGLVGGKGGFGSMLRAIGAQIEKTTNREACRDLSGRRLRDINEENRLRKWLDGQEDREKEAATQKQKKLEKLLAEPKIEVNMSASYEKERQDLPDRISAAVDAGWHAAGSSNDTGIKRKALTVEKVKDKKKAKLWIDADLSDCSSLSDDEEGDDIKSPTQVVSTDSGNESECSSEITDKV